MKTRDRPKVLCLGMSYPDIARQMEQEGFRKDLLQETTPGVKQVVECVRRNILTQMDGRDLARCIAMERKHRVGAYTASQERGSVYDTSKHLFANFNRSSFVKSLKTAFGEDVRFRQIILDYFWIPQGTWVMTHWGRSFFQVTLPLLADLIEEPQGTIKSELEVGVIFLPFCFHCCKQIVAGLSKLDQHYEISFVKKDELRIHALWSGTMEIDALTMQHHLGKCINQEEFYCTFSPRDVTECMDDCTVTKHDVIQILRCIEDFDQIRMIRLKPLRAKLRAPGMHSGGFVGLTDPTQIERGFDQLAVGGNRVTDSSDNSAEESDDENETGRTALKPKAKCGVIKRKAAAEKKASLSKGTNHVEDEHPPKRTKLYTVTNDLESYRLLDTCKKISNLYKIKKLAQKTLFPDSRRTYWDIINNNNCRRPYVAEMIRYLDVKVDDQLRDPVETIASSSPTVTDTTHDNNDQVDTLTTQTKFCCSEEHMQAIPGDENLAVLLLLLKKNLQLYPCVHPKVLQFEENEGRTKNGEEEDRRRDRALQGSELGKGRLSNSIDTKNRPLARDVDRKGPYDGAMGIKGRSLIWDIDNNPLPQATKGNECLQAKISCTFEVSETPIYRRKTMRCSKIRESTFDPITTLQGKGRYLQLEAAVSYTRNDRLFCPLKYRGSIQGMFIDMLDVLIVKEAQEYNRD